MQGIHDPNRQLQLVAAVSCVGCALVVLTSLFASLRGKLFMHVIACVSLSTMAGNAPYLSVYRPPNGSVWCAAQGFLVFFFYPASWVWTAILMGFLSKVAVDGRCAYSQALIHSVGWGLPLLTTLVPLSTNRFARFSDEDDSDVCTVGGPFDTAFLWHILSYYGVLLACLVVIFVLYVRLQRRRRSGDIAVSPQMAKLVVDSLKLYPLFLAICWIPEIVAFVIQYVADNDSLYHAALLIKLSSGLVKTCIFFGNSQHARNVWIQLFCWWRQRLDQRNYSTASMLSEQSDIFGGDFIEAGQDPFARQASQRPLLDESFCFQSFSDTESVIIR